MKTKLIFLAALLFSTVGFSQAPDTVIVKVGEGSKVLLSIKDKKDLETLKKYNFQKLIDKMIYKLEMRDSTQLNRQASEFLKKDSVPQQPVVAQESNNESSSYSSRHERKYHGRRTHNSFSVDIGTNNYLNNGKFPDQSNSLYSVRPWGSWYVGLNSIYRTRMANKFFLEWGGGVSWYNFKFENNQTLVTKDNTGVLFDTDTRNFSFTKSKLTAAYVNISAVPVIDFGGNRRKPSFFDGRSGSGFRIGVGPYVGYLIDSYTKQVYNDNNSKKREVHHNNYYLNNLRYGLRAQIGFNDVDFFFNYDMNQLFADNKGPQLNAFSFGISF
ncbi:MAG: hypothetical protein JSS79_20935 [Bacteroidetes bacterium]|nr:hypothetical protein [Bacteroidota bacterium]